MSEQKHSDELEAKRLAAVKDVGELVVEAEADLKARLDLVDSLNGQRKKALAAKTTQEKEVESLKDDLVKLACGGFPERLFPAASSELKRKKKLDGAKPLELHPDDAAKVGETLIKIGDGVNWGLLLDVMPAVGGGWSYAFTGSVSRSKTGRSKAADKYLTREGAAAGATREVRQWLASLTGGAGAGEQSARGSIVSAVGALEAQLKDDAATAAASADVAQLAREKSRPQAKAV